MMHTKFWNSFTRIFSDETPKPSVYIAIFFMAAALLFAILFYNFTLNSQNLPRYDGVAYQYLYSNTSTQLAGIPFGEFLIRILRGEFFHNSFIPFLAFINQKLGFVIPSYLSLGFSNVLLIFFGTLMSSVLFSLLLENKVTLTTSVIFFLLMLTQKIYWGLGNGWWDLRNDFSPALFALVNYLSVVIMVLKSRVSPALAITFIIGLLYIVLARPPMLLFQGLSTAIATACILTFSNRYRAKRIRVCLYLVLLALGPLLSLVTRLDKLKTYYTATGYDVGQWRLFKPFWTTTVVQVYGSLSIFFWFLTIVVIIAFFVKPEAVLRYTGLGSAKIKRLLLFILPAVVTFAFLNYQGTYGNPFGYILTMLLGCGCLAAGCKTRTVKVFVVITCGLVVVSNFSNAITAISLQIASDQNLLVELKSDWQKMNVLAGNKPYHVIFLTAAPTDCFVISMLIQDHRFTEQMPVRCSNLVHATQFGLPAKTNGREDLYLLRSKLATMNWLSSTDASTIQESNRLLEEPRKQASALPRQVFVWNLEDNDPDFGNAESYYYAHRVADVLKGEILRQGGKKVFSSHLLKSQIFRLLIK